MSQATWTAEEWAALTWLEKHAHNYPAWEAWFAGRSIQWWNGRRWCDDHSHAKDFEIVNIEHPQRVKPMEGSQWIDWHPKEGEIKPARYRYMYSEIDTDWVEGDEPGVAVDAYSARMARYQIPALVSPTREESEATNGQQ